MMWLIETVTKSAAAGFKSHKKDVWCITWSAATIGWSISFIKKEIPAGDFLFLGYLFLSLYGWLKWYGEDINKLTQQQAEGGICSSEKENMGYKAHSNGLLELFGG